MTSMSERAVELVEIYGNYPMARQFAANDLTSDLQDDEAPAYDAAFDPDPMTKRHAACDECRKRKLKCSGEPTGCGRCTKQQLTCHYSIQKQMGRPRKRQKTDQDDAEISNPTRARSRSPLIQLQPEPAIDPELTAKFSERANFENVCTGPVAQAIKRTSNQKYKNIPTPTSGPNTSSSHTSATGRSRSPSDDEPRTPPDGVPSTNISYPTDATLWPDFSEMSALPMPMQDRQRNENMIFFDPTNPEHPSIPYDPDADPSTLSNLPSIPLCPCLPNSYLTLSTLSTLSAFPVSSGTIDTLLGAHRTTKASLYCGVCPQKFQSGSQNVMLSSVLINVIADHWHRVRKASARELKTGFGSTADVADNSSSSSSSSSTTNTAAMTVQEELSWRTFGHNLVRAHVFGDAPVPQPPDVAATTNPNGRTTAVLASPVTLLAVLTTFERRQKQWHEQEPWTGEFPRRFSTDLQKGYTTAGLTMVELEKCHHQTAADQQQKADDQFLCLRIVDAGRRVVMSLDASPPSRVEV